MKSVVPPEFAFQTHTLPGNGGDRRRISAPRLQGAFSPPPQGLAPAVLSLVRGPWGYSSLSQPVSYQRSLYHLFRGLSSPSHRETIVFSTFFSILLTSTPFFVQFFQKHAVFAGERRFVFPMVPLFVENPRSPACFSAEKTGARMTGPRRVLITFCRGRKRR